MTMGFGCNAVGITGCRIIENGSMRLAAMVTNAFLPCNGRFPALIVLCGLLYPNRPLCAVVTLCAMIAGAVFLAMITTAVLTDMLPKGADSGFVLELPRFRRPKIGRILLRSFLDRTVVVLGRSLLCAAPMGALIWCLSNVQWNGISILHAASDWLDPVGLFLGMNGMILLAFILSFPANELFLPMVLLVYRSVFPNITLAGILGMWNHATILCTMVFMMLHWPCSAACLTVKKETGKWKWMFVSILLPLFWSVLICGILGRVG